MCFARILFSVNEMIGKKDANVALQGCKCKVPDKNENA